MINSVTISVDEYNALRDSQIRLDQMIAKKTIIMQREWRHSIITVVDGKEEALLILSRKLGEAEFELQMHKEGLRGPKMKWWRPSTW